MSKNVKSIGMQLGVGGRIAIPKEFRKALGIVQGERVVMMLNEEEHELHVFTVGEGVRRAQEWASTFIPEDASLVDELIAQRRAAAGAESAGDRFGGLQLAKLLLDEANSYRQSAIRRG